MAPEPRKGERSDPRGACYDQLRTCMSKHLGDYYLAHPDRLLDQRSVEKVEMMRKALACILDILDGYTITKGETQ